MGAVVVDAMSLLPLPRSFGVSPSSSSSSPPSSLHLRFFSTNRLAPHPRATFLRLGISNGGSAIRSVVCSSVSNSLENYGADSSKSPSQCAGCLVYHKFVNNLGLVVEYDLREEYDVDSDGTD
ncbi:hypothetical protein ACMD2_24273 [Ananas comosus]|uniref:Uncharacterized protein n=1 Tax=Ananas comosus TaxID=4615 RepID=A0A199UQ56_ANACO|nr:hypothetical protein ACMD2_24273 [Ananas comosus]